jgi:hypothetical protein
VAGKNFSRNRSRVLRGDVDLYQTPYCLTREFISALLKDEDLSNRGLPYTVADLCCGRGAIGHVLRQIGIECVDKDIQLNGYDYFNDHNQYEIGIMNPPFRHWNEWAFEGFKKFSRWFALLGPTTYLQGIGRFNGQGTGVFQNPSYPLIEVYTFNRFPMLTQELREDGLIDTGMQALSWFLFASWDRVKGTDRADRVTRHYWLDIDKYVARKGRGRKIG